MASSSTVDPSQLSDFAKLAEVFCELVETAETRPPDGVLHELHVLLARLYLGALLLPPPFSLLSDECLDDDASADAVRARTGRAGKVVPRLSHIFGERNFYREVFDPYAPDSDEEVIGSLNDDVGDIYDHLRDGLDLWHAGAFGEALFEWRFNFEFHWSEHATGALRALFARSAWYDMGWPDVETAARARQGV